jgi:hypothetical protein
MKTQNDWTSHGPTENFLQKQKRKKQPTASVFVIHDPAGRAIEIRADNQFGSLTAARELADSIETLLEEHGYTLK